MIFSRDVLIRGDGVAAYCCAYLLRQAGFRIAIERSARSRVPAIMLSTQAVSLIRDVFGQSALLSGAATIDRRVVAWGKASESVSVAHAAFVTTEDALVESLAQSVTPDPDISPGFIVHASGSSPKGAEMHRFGSRRAAAMRVTLRDGADQSGCWIESLEAGWLFLIPNALGSTWLLGVGGPVEQLLAASRIIAPRIGSRDAASGEFDVCPRLLSPLYGDGWLVCGGAALAFDPICGDGTAQAIREAILASAVVAGIANGGDAPSLLHHYETALTGAMRRHLMLCAEFYRTGGEGAWWQAELDGLLQGHRWCSEKMNQSGARQYQLKGFELVACG